MINPRVVYHPKYDLYLPLFEHLHPFDGRKFSRAFHLLQEYVGPDLKTFTNMPGHEVGDTDLLRVHTAPYLSSLDSAQVLAEALQIAALTLIPAGLRKKHILSPMRLAVQGTITAAELALSLHSGLVFTSAEVFTTRSRIKVKASVCMPTRPSRSAPCDLGAYSQITISS